MSALLKNTKALIALGVVAVLVILGLIFFVSLNNTQKEMVAKETALSAQYSDNQNALSSYVSQIKEALGIADRNTQALDQVLTDAVKGRYDGDTSAQPGGGQMFSAIIEAYPDLTQMSVNYQKVQSAVFAGRDAFKNQQTRLLDMLRDFEQWKESGFIHSKMTSMVGAPSDNLRAAIGTDVVRGQAALDRMYAIVLTSDTKDAYQSGEMDPLDLGPTQSPAPASTDVEAGDAEATN